MKPLLLIMNPRRIPRCIEAFESLRIAKVWMSFFTERQLESVIPDVLRDARALGYTHAIILSDDTVPTQHAVNLVEHALKTQRIVTGYCNVSEEDQRVNITSRPFVKTDHPVPEDYAWMTKDEVENYPEPYMPQFFGGMCLTGIADTAAGKGQVTAALASVGHRLTITGPTNTSCAREANITPACRT